MIHGGLQINVKEHEHRVMVNQCCIRTQGWAMEPGQDFFNDPRMMPLREINREDRWAPGCENCQSLEAAGSRSFRQGTLEMFGRRDHYRGPVRLDLMFDTSCNLACRTCGPNYSTYWQRHLKDHGRWSQPIRPLQRSNEIITLLEPINLDDLELIVYCGGETLLGSAYWELAEYFASRVPHARDRLILSFQTNGTQAINPRYHSIIEKFHLVKLNISLDGVGKKFEFLRWPALWDQTVANIMTWRDDLPSNVMFLVEETVSMLNVSYQQELADWVANHFASNREGDPVDHTRHLAGGTFALLAMTQEHADHLVKQEQGGLIPGNFQEQPRLVQAAVDELRRVDQWRDQDWTKTFPETAEFYSRYL